ncbi:hypothetical protein [Gorillibacterium sp. sgz5001074]|uniref:hypothetical protein n=1 Tax=Gorillibacterium sp. sgz5001074 TaxID=3446695 RepID=UPI003F667CD4
MHEAERFMKQSNVRDEPVSRCCSPGFTLFASAHPVRMVVPCNAGIVLPDRLPDGAQAEKPLEGSRMRSSA